VLGSRGGQPANKAGWQCAGVFGGDFGKASTPELASRLDSPHGRSSLRMRLDASADPTESWPAAANYRRALLDSALASGGIWAPDTRMVSYWLRVSYA